MKKLSLLFAFFVLFSTACNNDDDAILPTPNTAVPVVHQGIWKGGLSKLRYENISFEVESIEGKPSITLFDVTSDSYAFTTSSPQGLTSIADNKFSFSDIVQDGETKREISGQIKEEKIDGQDLFEVVVKIYKKENDEFKLSEDLTFVCYQGRWEGTTDQEEEVILDIREIDGEQKLFFFWLKKMELDDNPHYGFFSFDFEEGIASIVDDQLNYSIQEIGTSFSDIFEISADLDGNTLKGEMRVSRLNNTSQEITELGRTAFEANLKATN